MLEGEKLITIPEGPTWNPHSEHFSLNEDSYPNWNGETVQKHHRRTTNLIEEEVLNLEVESVLANTRMLASSCSDVNVSGPSKFGIAFVPYEDDEEIPRTIPENEAVDARKKPISQQSVTDALTNIEVLLPHWEELLAAKVIRRSMAEDDTVLGDYNDMPVFKTMLYDVEFPDGTIKPYTANVIADNIYDQVDSEGSNIVKSIDDHSTDDNAVSKENQFVVDKHGRRHLWKTTAG